MFEKNKLNKNIKSIHFRGIGGISMSGIASTLKSFGYNITGSDDNSSNQTEILKKKGIYIVIGKDLENVRKADLLIYTNSIPNDDEELELARSINIPIMERAEALGLITKEYKNTIAIAGTNGKTTTTGMTSVIFLNANKDPSIQIGAYLKNIDANYRTGKSDILIYEACEYKESFLNFDHETAVILNIDYDHLDYFKDLNNIKQAFLKFVKKTKIGGNIILNINNENVRELKKVLEIELKEEQKIDDNINLGNKYNILTYGLTEEADVYAKDIEYIDNLLKYKLYFKNEFLIDISLNIFGNFNVLNSLAAATVALAYNINPKDIKEGLENFYGAERRFEYRGKINGASVFDDYAHNPTKVKELYNAAKVFNKKIWIVFEPHTYSRTKDLFDEFVDALSKYDNVILTRIFAAREKNIFDIESDDIVDALNEKYNKNAIYIEKYEDIIKYLKENVIEDDIILFVGAGSINTLYNYV